MNQVFLFTIQIKSLNIFFYKANKGDNIPLALTKLYIDNKQIQQSKST